MTTRTNTRLAGARQQKQPGATSALVVAAALAVFGACDVVRQAPAGSTITLVASTNVLPVNGETEILALVVRGGSAPPATPGQNPAPTPTPSGIVVNDGTVVRFSTTLGTIDPVEARTTNGQAVVRLIGDGRSGTATVTAISGTSTSTVEVKIGVAGATRIVLTANPTVLPSGGGTTTISARVEDAQGNGLLGVPVNFSSNAGVLSQTGALTNNLGVATTTLETTTNATVTGAMGAAQGQSATVNVTVPPGGSEDQS